jgi:hypothetical protein
MTINMNELVRGGTACLSSPGLGIAGTTTKMRTTAADGSGYHSFAINGQLYVQADADNTCVFTAATQAALTTCLYVCCITAGNVITIIKGTEVLTADLTAGKKALHWPAPTADTCAFGAVKVVATAVFTAGTTALGTGNAVTYYNLFSVPAAPITS